MFYIMIPDYNRILEYLRQKRIAKIILWSLAIMVVPAFVLLGPGSGGRMGGDSQLVIGAVDYQDIHLDELIKNIEGIKSQLVLNYYYQPEALDTMFKDKEMLAELGWKRLILLREAGKYLIQIPDREVIKYIRLHPMFMRKGSFDPRLYGDIVSRYMGLRPKDFEEMVRGNMAVSDLKDLFAKDIAITDEEALLAYRRDNEKIKISYVLIADSDLPGKANIDDAKVRDYYKKNKLEFITPTKEGEEAEGVSDLEAVKESIRKHLADNEAISSANTYVEDVYKKILDAMEKEKATFEDAASKLGLKVKESPLFSRSEKVEGLEESDFLLDVAVSFTKPDQLSNPIKIKNGIIIFKVSETKGIDEEKFKKEKASYAEKLLETRKLNMLDKQYATISVNARLNLDMKDIVKRIK